MRSIAGMQHDLKSLSARISKAFEGRAKLFRSGTLFVKITLIAFFSAIVAVAQFLQFGKDGPDAGQVTGILASLVVLIGSVFVLITEQDASEDLALAQEALEAARDTEAQYEFIEELFSDNARLIELFQALLVLRGAIEHLAANPHVDENQVVANLLKVCERSLAIAMNFAQSDQWTIGIYKAIPSSAEPGKIDLKCIAHKRAIECDVDEARVWREGTGIMGVAYSNHDEIIVPDLQAEGMRTVFGSAANEQRDYDVERYRSMVAVPIKVEGMDKPWGIVTSTTDQVGHFSQSNAKGVRTDEGVRILSGMVALAIAVIRKKAA
jgi:hypothetical protein